MNLDYQTRCIISDNWEFLAHIASVVSLTGFARAAEVRGPRFTWVFEIQNMYREIYIDEEFPVFVTACYKCLRLIWLYMIRTQFFHVLPPPTNYQLSTVTSQERHRVSNHRWC